MKGCQKLIEAYHSILDVLLIQQFERPKSKEEIAIVDKEIGLLYIDYVKIVEKQFHSTGFELEAHVRSWLEYVSSRHRSATCILHLPVLLRLSDFQEENGANLRYDDLSARRTEWPEIQEMYDRALRHWGVKKIESSRLDPLHVSISLAYATFMRFVLGKRDASYQILNALVHTSEGDRPLPSKYNENPPHIMKIYSELELWAPPQTTCI